MPANDVRTNGSGAAAYFATQAQLRPALYRLFGGLFLYPDAARVTTMRSVAAEMLPFTAEWSAVPFGADLTDLLRELAALSPGASQPLEEEYNRLFAVKPAAPPYASVYLDPQRNAVGMITLNLERAYAEAGLAVSPNLKEPPDHVAVELEYLAFLCNETATAEELHETERAAQARVRQRQFLERHFARWFGLFVNRVSAASPAQLYEVVVRAADAFVRHELDTASEQPKQPQARFAGCL